MSAWGKVQYVIFSSYPTGFIENSALNNNSLPFHCHPIKLEAFILLFQDLWVSSGGKKHEMDSFHSIAGRVDL